VNPRRLLALVLCAAGAASSSSAADRAAAERAYERARRLVAAGAPEAATALEQVLALDPEGPLADDALTDLALLAPLPHWPEDLGRIEASEAEQALARLDRVVESFPTADRAAEARYHRALLWLEPLPLHDTAAARDDLAAAGLDSRARYALGWLAEREGKAERAAQAYQRVLIDEPASPAAARARVGRARLALREGENGHAARLLQEALETGLTDELLARPLRTLALRTLLRAEGEERAAPVVVTTPLRGVIALAPLPDGGALFALRREERVVRLDADGVETDAWSLPQLQALAVDERGRGFAAADSSVHRLEPGGRTVPVASTEGFAPLDSLAVDGLGGVWVLDRRGERLGRIEPGADRPDPVLDAQPRMRSIVWDGRRLVAVEPRGPQIVELAAGLLRPLAPMGLERPVALAADPGGRLAVLDARSAGLTWVDPGGGVAASVATPSIARRAAAVGAGFDGSLHLFDDADGRWVRLP
jgi:hypothetical protein